MTGVQPHYVERVALSVTNVTLGCLGYEFRGVGHRD